MMQFFPSVSSPFTQHKLSNYKITKKKSKPSLKQSVSSIQKQLSYQVSHTPFPHAPPSSPSLLHSLPSRGMHCFSPLQGLAAQHLTWVCDVNIKRSPEKACRLLWQHSAGPGTEHQMQQFQTGQTPTPWPAQLRAPTAPTAPWSHSREPTTAGQEQGTRGFSSSCQVKYSTVFPLDNKSLPVWKLCIFTQVRSLSTCSYRKFLSMFMV